MEGWREEGQKRESRFWTEVNPHYPPKQSPLMFFYNLTVIMNYCCFKLGKLPDDAAF